MKTELIAEIGINSNGDVNIAKKLIDEAVNAGFQYVKFQKRTIEDVYTKEELDKPRESPWGKTNREQKMGLEFGKKEYDQIDSYCKEKGIQWFASVWDEKSVDFLMQYNPPYIKVPSALITNISLLKKIRDVVKGTNTKIIIATGMSDWKEIENCLIILNYNVECILICTSSYPTPVEDLNMSRILKAKSLFPKNIIKIGFSNHSQSVNFMLMAYCLGSEMIEMHITLDRTMYGSDQSASIEPQGMQRVSKIIKAYEKAWGDENFYCTKSEIPVKEKLRKI